MEELQRESIGAVVRTLRVAAGLSRQELVERSGDHAEDRLGLEMLAKVEQGRKAPSARTLRKIAAALGIEPQDLVARAAHWEAGTEAGASAGALRTVALGGSLRGGAAVGLGLGMMLPGGPLVGASIAGGALMYRRSRAQRAELAAQLEARLQEKLAKSPPEELERILAALDAVEEGDEQIG